MWGLISVGVLAVLAASFSLARSASRGDEMAESHREEWLARKKGAEKEPENDENK